MNYLLSFVIPANLVQTVTEITESEITNLPQKLEALLDGDTLLLLSIARGAVDKTVSTLITAMKEYAQYRGKLSLYTCLNVVIHLYVLLDFI